MKRLEHYYFEGDWREDFEAYENGEVPKDQPCGVLSEDLVFNASVAQQGLAIEYLKVVTKNSRSNEWKIIGNTVCLNS